MPLRQCSFCDYNTIYKHRYYNHVYTHNTPDNVCKLSEDELKLCEFYHSKHTQLSANYRQNNKDKISQKKKEYYQNNKDKITEYYQNNRDKILQKKKEYRQNNRDKILQQKKEYSLRKKLEKEDANILDVYDSD